MQVFADQGKRYASPGQGTSYSQTCPVVPINQQNLDRACGIDFKAGSVARCACRLRCTNVPLLGALGPDIGSFLSGMNQAREYVERLKSFYIISPTTH